MVSDNVQIATGLADTLIHRMHAAGYELQRSLPLVTSQDAAEQIGVAVEHLNEAIKAIQLAASFGPQPL